MDENNNNKSIAYDQQNKLQFRKEAQLLAAILGQENEESKPKLENQSDIDLNEHSSLIKKEKKNSKFWLNIDLELEDAMMESPSEAVEEVSAAAEEQNGESNGTAKETDKAEVERQELNKLEQAFGHQKLENKENPNRVNLLKIKQQLEVAVEEQAEPNLLELLDAEC